MGHIQIAAAAESTYSRRPPSNATTAGELAVAAELAVQAAGLDVDEIDGLGVSSFSLTPDRAIDLAVRLGLRVRWLMDGGTGGASGIDMLQHAADAITAGSASCVLLLAGDVMTREDSAKLGETYNVARRDHLAPIHTGSNALFSLLTQRHMAAHHLDRAAYATVPVKQREWASRNPGAVYRESLSLDDYLAAPIVADPLCIYDCVPVVAGADALIVNRGTGGVRVRALAACHNPESQVGDGLRTGMADLAAELWSSAALAPEQVDLLSIYDDYPVMVLIQLADLGFGDPQRVLDLLSRDRLRVNTSGGQLSAGQAGAAGGMHGLVEVYRQLSGTAGARQTTPARFGLVSGYGMVAYRYGASANAVVLEAQI